VALLEAEHFRAGGPEGKATWMMWEMAHRNRWFTYEKWGFAMANC
jgi:hypothetical protein